MEEVVLLGTLIQAQRRCRIQTRGSLQDSTENYTVHTPHSIL